MKRLLQIFESRFATGFCIIFAIINRIIFATHYPTVGRDTRMQITYAKNLIAGKGFGVTKYFTSDLTTPVFDITQYFPPGFSFVIIPFLKLFKDDYGAVLAFDIAVILFFVFTVRGLAKVVELPTSLQNILLLMIGCTQYTFIILGSSTDVIGLTILLLSLTFMIKIISGSKSITWGKLFLYGLVFFFHHCSDICICRFL